MVLFPGGTSKRSLDDKLASLVEPGIDATKEAGKLLENLPTLWEEANLSERRNILLSILDAVYVDTVEEKAIVALRPKPAFRPLFEIAITRKGSDVVLINEPPPASNEPEAADSCFWWRRGRVGCSLFANTVSSSLTWQKLNTLVELASGRGDGGEWNSTRNTDWRCWWL